MLPDVCLRVCLVGDPGAGHTSFLRCYQGDGGDPTTFKIESIIAMVEVDRQQCAVRFIGNVGSPFFDSMRGTVLGAAHAVLFCISVDSPEQLSNIKETWLPGLRATGSEAPTFLLGLRGDLRASRPCIPELELREFARNHGMSSYLEASVMYPETVRDAVEAVLPPAKEYYGLQWQLGPPKAAAAAVPDDAAEDAPWLVHERLNVADDPFPVELETVRKSLSMLGVTHTRQHAYLRIDLANLGLTSIDAVRTFVNLQFVNVSGNRLRSLEPLGAIRCLLHLNASLNLLVRTQGFAAPDGLETVDLAYNMIGDLGNWGVHKYLRELNLRGNFISRIGPGLRRNKELRILDLSENYLGAIENMEGLDLRTLNLAQNRLTSLEGIESLRKLQVLNVRHNNVMSIAALRSEDIPRLRQLNISDNRISHIKEIGRRAGDQAGGLESFPFLCDLLVAPNPVVQLPYYRAQALHRLPRLRSLDGQNVTAEEKVKADLIYGADVEKRKEIFEQLLPDEQFGDRRLVTEEGITSMELEKFGQEGDAGPYGCEAEQPEGDVGEGGQWHRSRFPNARFRHLLSSARAGGAPQGTADFSEFAAPFCDVVVIDADVPEILEAVCEGGIERLILRGADLTARGVRDILSVLKSSVCGLWFVDLTSVPAVDDVHEIMNTFPYDKGCSIEAEDTGLPADCVRRLRNETPEAAEVRRRALAERQRTAELRARYGERQAALEDYALERCSRDSPPEPPPPLYHPLQWREGIETIARRSYKTYRTSNTGGLAEERGPGGAEQWSMRGKNGVKLSIGRDEYAALGRQRDAMLKEWGYVKDVEVFEDLIDEEAGELLETVATRRLERGEDSRALPQAFEERFTSPLESADLIGFMIWEGAQPDQEVLSRIRRQREEWEAAWVEEQRRFDTLSLACKKPFEGSPLGVGGGQLMAHFTYLCLNCQLSGKDVPRKWGDFGLKRHTEAPRSQPTRGRALFEAVSAGRVSIENCTGRGYGEDALHLTLRNEGPEDLVVTVHRGTIFEHVDWQHRQNLMVAFDYVVPLPASGVVAKVMFAYCLNLSCACPNGSPMNLTDLYFDNEKAMQTQGLVWDHFENCFTGSKAL